MEILVSSDAASDATNKRYNELSFFKSSTKSSSFKTLWAGDFNMQPNKNNIDGARFRDYVKWENLNTSDTGGEDFLKPLRTENQTNAMTVWPIYLNLDHVLASENMNGSWSCKVLYENKDRLDGYKYLWYYKAGGMDHRAVASGTSFTY